MRPEKQKRLQRRARRDRSEFEDTQSPCNTADHCLRGEWHHFRLCFVLTKRSRSVVPCLAHSRGEDKKLKISSTFSPCGCAKLTRPVLQSRGDKVKCKVPAVSSEQPSKQPRSRNRRTEISSPGEKQAEKGLGNMSGSSVLTCKHESLPHGVVGGNKRT